MFIFTQFIKDEINLDARRREMVAEFSDTENNRLHTHKFSFGIKTDERVIKNTVAQYLNDDLNFVPSTVTDITVTAEPIIEQTPQEKREANYQQKREALKTLKEDVSLGLATQAQYDLALADVIDWRDK